MRARRDQVAAVVVGGILLAAGAARAEQFVAVDVTYTHGPDTTRDSHYRVKPSAESPADWRRPVDYASGTAYVHVEVTSKPSAAATRFQMCFEATPSYACTAQSPTYTTAGTVEWVSKFSGFYQYDRVDWSKGVRNIALILKDTKNGKPAPENVGAERAAEYMPTKLRVVLTIVSPGATYVPPAVIAGAKPTGGGATALDVGRLEAEIRELRALLPDQGQVMADVGRHFGGLWAAAAAKNWDLARFRAEEARALLRRAVRVRPSREAAGGEVVELGPLLAAFEREEWKQLGAALEARQKKPFESAYSRAAEGCNGCHAKAAVPFVRVRARPDASGEVLEPRPR